MELDWTSKTKEMPRSHRTLFDIQNKRDAWITWSMAGYSK